MDEPQPPVHQVRPGLHDRHHQWDEEYLPPESRVRDITPDVEVVETEGGHGHRHDQRLQDPNPLSTSLLTRKDRPLGIPDCVRVLDV